MTKHIVEVALPVPLRRNFDYLLPPENTNAAVGTRVLVPFGRRKMIGIIVSHKTSSTIDHDKLKSIHQLIDTQEIISADLMQLCVWASEYYHQSLGEVLFTALPKLLREGQLPELRNKYVIQLTEQGLHYDLAILKRAPQQTKLLTLLREYSTGLTLEQLRTYDISESALHALMNKQLITKIIKIASAQPHPAPTEKLQLNSQQQHALDTLRQHHDQFKCYLLDGVTGSGKTEVYLQVIEDYLQQGKQSLLLIPEIGLTPQTLQRFQRRFAEHIIILHSALTDTERLNAWLMANSGDAKIIIGTRSAVYTPLRNLGIIIVDEEHDTSFKQQDGFRYSARDLAIRRAQMHNVPILLGSATPSLESYYNCHQQRYSRLVLTQRAGSARLPSFKLIDIRGQTLQQGLSSQLIQAIGEHLQQQQQVLLFINRRGYAPVLLCHQCGWIATCTRCDARLVLHKSSQRLRCHHCDASHPHIEHCPHCNFKPLLNVGIGTERLEHTLKQLFPQYQTLRIDRDNTRRKGSLQNMLNQIHAKQAHILIGTQMLAKGHHFPDVTLVAILDVDYGLYSVDFRATERMGQLIMQVAGRAGRSEKPGTVLIQTHHADHPLLHNLLTQGYHHFLEAILQERCTSHLPPYSYLALIRCEAKQLEKCLAVLSKIKQHAKYLASNTVELLGPIPAPQAKRIDKYRAQLLLQANQRKCLHLLLAQLVPYIEELPDARQIRWSLDIDPIDTF
ncbi:MAG: primosomal protein N' [Gammaproteobacteria bacterium]